MTMRRWQLFTGIATTLAVVMLCIWVFLHQRITDSAVKVLDDNQAGIRAIMANQDYLEIRSDDGALYIIVRSEEESFESWYKRADEAQHGILSSQQCATLHCTNGVVTICIACMVGESERDCHARLEEAVAVYCQTHNCEECK